MKSSLALCVLLSGVLASPAKQIPFQANDRVDEDFDFRKHMAGISPYYPAGGQVNSPPDHCEVVTAVYLVRHTAITFNDDEWDDYSKPVVKKLNKYKWKKAAHKSPLRFLKNWVSPVNDDNLEQMTGPGGEDAKYMGARMKDLYPQLLPNNTEPFKFWAADASRDINTAKEFIKGIVPTHANNGTGDDHVKLVQVPLAAPEGWASSLTPHKVCDAFSKKNGKKEKRHFEKIYTKPARKRFEKALPGFDFTPNDIVGLQMLCGYELVINGTSPICSLFTKEDWLGFEYAQDLHYNKMVGYGSDTAPYLGFPWLSTATHHLLTPTGHPDFSSLIPEPSKPPNTTAYQNLFFYFTHREEIPVVLVTLGLFKDKKGALPDNKINPDRQWRSSRIMPFLGHVALERIHCKKEAEGDKDFVRVLVNEAYVGIPGCDSGPGETCPIDDFRKFYLGKKEAFGDFKAGCKKHK